MGKSKYLLVFLSSLFNDGTLFWCDSFFFFVLIKVLHVGTQLHDLVTQELHFSTERLGSVDHLVGEN